jgi:uncharacterized protein (TIGR02453 family)
MKVAERKAATTGFQGFGPQALDFFKGLAFHQSKEWFLEHKALYERDVKGPLTLLIADLTAEFAARGIPLAGQGERSIFRIHRDIRFSKDKSPYKTHAGATLTRDGTKISPGLFYIHIAPGGSFAAAGFYHPDPQALAAIRLAIASESGRWLRLEQTLEGAGLVLSREDRVTRVPRGFHAGESTEIAEALKLKSFIVRQPLAHESVFQPKLIRELTEFAEAARPLLDFGWSSIDRRKSGD